jgi:hypothetical protein
MKPSAKCLSLLSMHRHLALGFITPPHGSNYRVWMSER